MQMSNKKLNAKELCDKPCHRDAVLAYSVVSADLYLYNSL